MQMGEGLDTGPLLLERPCPIRDADTSLLGAEALMAVLPGVADCSLSALSQDESRANHARKMEKIEARINWEASRRSWTIWFGRLIPG